MDHVAISEDQVMPLEAIARGVQGLRIIFVNVFVVAHPDGSWTLIDAALPYSDGMIRRWAEKHFSTPPTSIILTHGHFDHVSAAGALAEHCDVPVYAHPLEFPYLTGLKEYSAPNVGAGGGLMPLLSPTFPRGPIDLGTRLRQLPTAETGPVSLAEMPGWQILHTPGHTPGHVSFFRPEDSTLLLATPSAPPSRNLFLKPRSPSRRSCMGRPPTSPPTGIRRANRSSASLRSHL